MKFKMGGGSKDDPKENPNTSEQETSNEFDSTDKCNSCPPSYELSSNGAFSSKLSLARTNSSNSIHSATGNGSMVGSSRGMMGGMGQRSASSSSFTLDKAKSRSMSRSMSITSFNAMNDRPMSRAMSSASFYFDSIKDDFEDEGDFSLQYTRHERVPCKNFGNDIRAISDVESYVKNATLILDLDETNLEAILESLLEHVLTEDEPHANIHDCKLDLFTHDSACVASDTSAHHLSKTMQGTYKTTGGGMDYDQQWITVLCTLPTIQKRHVALARLKRPANLGRTSQEVHFIILVVAPTKQKGAKNALELGRTFSTLFTDMEIRYQLQNAAEQEEFLAILSDRAKSLAAEQRETKKKRKMSVVDEEGGGGGKKADHHEEEEARCVFGKGLSEDIKRRLPYYLSDYVDGFVGPRTIGKTLSTTFFLYFACLLPTIALGSLNDYETYGKIGVKEAIYGQVIAGLFFAFVGGQPMTVLLTTAPLAIYVKIVYAISQELGYDFLPMYAMVGLWNGFFCVVFALLDVSNIMNWARRSTEEVFACFVAVAYAVDAGKGIYKEFKKNYKSEYCKDKSYGGKDKYGDGYGSDYDSNSSLYNTSYGNDYTTASSIYGYNDTNATGYDGDDYYGVQQCLRENSILHLMLALGTVWLGLFIFNFTKTPYLNTNKRELLASYALPLAALVMSFFGSFVFRDIDLTEFNYSKESVFKFTRFEGMDIGSGFVCMGLGFCLSLLFMVDQHECAGLVNIPDNRLKKGNAYHWDLLVVGVLNVILSGFGFPMVHGALPHSPLHVRAMADMEDRIDQGRITQFVMRARETRVTTIFSHILIGLSLLLLPYPLQYIPKGVLDGIFLYLAIAGLDGSQFFERILLLFTEQAAYPPNHYIRGIPQRKLHLFTLLQILQLAAMCAIGFSPLPYLKMTFPILIICLLPVRHNLIPLFIETRYLTLMDGHH